MTRQVKGIILQKQDYRENDRLFSLYTDELGKIEAVARGARKIKSKMAGHLELFSIINLMVAPGRTYYQIAGADQIKNLLNIKKDLAKTVLGSFCLEIVDVFTKPEHPDSKIYELLEEILKIFNNSEVKDFLKMYSLSKFFVLKILSFLGWTPELYDCLKCKKKIVPNGNYFNAERGGLICGQCARNDLPISTAGIKILRFILKNDFKKAAALKIGETQIKELAKIVDTFMAVRQDREVKSALWINYLTQASSI